MRCVMRTPRIPRRWPKSCSQKMGTRNGSACRRRSRRFTRVGGWNMTTHSTGPAGSGQATTRQGQGEPDSPLTNATFNMVAALHNLSEGVWQYDVYIEQDDDEDAKEMWRNFKRQQMQMATELKNHLSRRLQHETGPEGKVGHGPHEGGGQTQ